MNDSQRQLKRVGDRREEELGYLKRELQEIRSVYVTVRACETRFKNKNKNGVKNTRQLFWQSK